LASDVIWRINSPEQFAQRHFPWKTGVTEIKPLATMKKTLLMLAGFAMLFGAAVACFTPSSTKDKSSPVHEEPETATEHAPTD
jgi:hypothetical protein